MAFVYKPGVRRIEVEIEDDEGKEEKIVLFVKRPEVSDLEAYVRAEGNTTRNTMVILSHVEGWEGVVDSEGAEVPFTRENFNRLPLAAARIIAEKITDVFFRRTLEKIGGVGASGTGIGSSENPNM